MIVRDTREGVKKMAERKPGCYYPESAQERDSHNYQLETEKKTFKAYVYVRATIRLEVEVPRDGKAMCPELFSQTREQALIQFGQLVHGEDSKVMLAGVPKVEVVIPAAEVQDNDI